jgi:hypothetical protein
MFAEKQSSSQSILEIFQDLGERIEAEWRAVNNDEEKFPAIAAEFLRDEDLPSKVSPWEILEWGLKQTEFPRQKDPNANFGEPPITLYTSPKFYIDVYFWFEGTTAIHQHAFCGAFQVLHGSSIHSWYDFECTEPVNSYLQIGKMNLKVCELLEQGAVQEIWGGKRYIHALFHLDSPSVTICVRTDKNPVDMPQYSYHKPSLALDPFYEEETVKKKMQIISGMVRAERPNMDECFAELLERSDFQTTFLLLNMLKRSLASNQLNELFGVGAVKERFNNYLAAAERRHGSKIDVLRDVFDYMDRSSELIKRRSIVKDPEHRFFMALLMNADGRERIYSLVEQRYPEIKPREKVLDWVFDLAQTRVVGNDQQNALGVMPFDDLDLTIFEYLLDGRTADEAADSIRAEYPAEKLAAAGDLTERISKVCTAAIFQPLFA